MNLRDLQYLVAVADTQHFGKAADQCFVSQPTLSMQIKKLEQELGITAFERTNKQVLLTPAGEALAAQARIVLEEANTLREIAKQSQNPLSGTIKLGVIPTLGPYLLPHAVAKLRRQLPEIEFMFIERQTEQLLEQLKKGHLDAIILALPVDAHGLTVRKLFSEFFMAAVPSDHPLAQRKRIKLEDLQQETLLLLEEGHCLRDQALAVCQKFDGPQAGSFAATSLETLRNMVAMGSGITLLPSLATEGFKASGKQVAIIPFTKPAPHRQIAMLWRTRTPKTQCMHAIASCFSA